ncbi:MAG: putative membrane protein [Flavobacterium sp.]|jgi:putative membrane protein
MLANFNHPQRQSLSGVIILFMNSLQKIGRAFVPILVVFFLKIETASVLLMILGAIGIMILIGIFAYLKYLNFTFYIDEKSEEFIVNDGVFNKSKIVISLHKIQQVSIHQNLLQRIINIYEISVDTAGTDKQEGNIKAVSHEVALALKEKLLENRNIFENLEKDVTVETEKKMPFLRIQLINLFKIGITSNYAKSIGLIITFFFTIYENLHNIGKEDVLTGLEIESKFNSYPILISILIAIAGLFFVVFLINIFRTVLKYFNFTIEKQKGSLLLSYGLISKQSTIVKPEKVQIVSVSQNYFQKKLRILEIKIKQATGDDAKKSKSGIEILGCNDAEKNQILNLVFDSIPQANTKLKPNWRKLVFAIFLSIILPLSAFLIVYNYTEINLKHYVPIAVFYVIFVAIIQFFSFYNYRLYIGQKHIIKKHGAWERERSIIEINKIQAITTAQLFWHKNLNIGTVTLHTAGGNLSFYLGNFDMIQNYTNQWLYDIETSDSNWM